MKKTAYKGVEHSEKGVPKSLLPDLDLKGEGSLMELVEKENWLQASRKYQHQREYGERTKKDYENLAVMFALTVKKEGEREANAIQVQALNVLKQSPGEEMVGVYRRCLEDPEYLEAAKKRMIDSLRQSEKKAGGRTDG